MLPFNRFEAGSPVVLVDTWRGAAACPGEIQAADVLKIPYKSKEAVEGTREGSVPDNAHEGSVVITLVGTITIKPEHDQEFVPLAMSTAELVRRQEPDTILYLSHGHPTEAHAYAFVKRYRDAAAWQTHREAPYVQGALAKLQNCAVEPPDTLRLTQIVFDIQRAS
jgi:quinol monooxygenase YgiN